MILVGPSNKILVSGLRNMPAFRTISLPTKSVSNFLQFSAKDFTPQFRIEDSIYVSKMVGAIKKEHSLTDELENDNEIEIIGADLLSDMKEYIHNVRTYEVLC